MRVYFSSDDKVLLTLSVGEISLGRGLVTTKSVNDKLLRESISHRTESVDDKVHREKFPRGEAW